MKIRLDKYLSDSGFGSRSQVKELIRSKRVHVNQQVVTSPKHSVDLQVDSVTVDQEPVQYEKYVYYMLNKPKGVISATEDAKHATVMDLLDPIAVVKEAFPVGRLDIDTHGLLLITNNGGLAHALLSPKKHVAKTYRAHVQGIMTDEDQEKFQEGIVLEDGFKCMPARLSILENNTTEKTSLVEITIKEGKFHQVKRMVKVCGKTVMDLQRLSMGELHLDPELQKGDFRPLTNQELKLLKNYYSDI